MLTLMARGEIHTSGLPTQNRSQGERERREVGRGRTTVTSSLREFGNHELLIRDVFVPTDPGRYRSGRDAVPVGRVKEIAQLFLELFFAGDLIW